MATPAPAAMHRIIAREGCWLDNRENRPILFIMKPHLKKSILAVIKTLKSYTSLVQDPSRAAQ
jgi:hypothetical protein